MAGEKVGDGNLALQSKIGLLPDVPAFYDWMSGREFLHFVGELHGLTPNEIKKRTEELLELVELRKAGNRRTGGYSRGMRQRLGIAQALVNRPKVLFLDEPTSAFDPLGRREVLNLILRLRENTTIFMSSHNLSDIERVCDMVGIVDKGQLITVSTVEALQKKYTRSIFELEFMGCRPVRGDFKENPVAGGTCNCNREWRSHGRCARCRYRPRTQGIAACYQRERFDIDPL